jgi:hypothetical protein
MSAQQILDSIQNENIGSVIFRCSQGRDSTVGGSGYSGVCEGMCYNFVRVKLFQPNADFSPTTPLGAFRLGKMWQLYQFTYNRNILRRYQCLDPRKERDS